MVDDASLPRAVVDTNVLIRGILSSTGASTLVVDAIFRRQCFLITSRTHLNELHGVLSRPRFVNRYGIIELLRHYGTHLVRAGASVQILTR
jgi:putative PIN family toxin of toxin-antitoxin system